MMWLRSVPNVLNHLDPRLIDLVAIENERQHANHQAIRPSRPTVDDGYRAWHSVAPFPLQV